MIWVIPSLLVGTWQGSPELDGELLRLEHMLPCGRQSQGRGWQVPTDLKSPRGKNRCFASIRTPDKGELPRNQDWNAAAGNTYILPASSVLNYGQ